jgi:hypothetical protein
VKRGAIPFLAQSGRCPISVRVNLQRPLLKLLLTRESPNNKPQYPRTDVSFLSSRDH